jgi:general secretion pathway protein G
MRPAQHRRVGREAFTLIELLVVISIIAVLAALLLVAVFRAGGSGQLVQSTNDVRQLQDALQQFKSKYGFFPPSRIKLCKRLVDYNFWIAGTPPVMGQLEADSIAYLSKLAPRITDNTPIAASTTTPKQTKSPWMCTNPPPFAAPPAGGPNVDFIDWDGTGTYTPASGLIPPGYIVLEGDQCLVWFLGGMPTTAGGIASCTGFSTNPFNPGLPRLTSTESRIGPFYQFESSRLQSISHSGVIGTNSPVFFSYWDQYLAMPFVYFSSYKTANGYNRYFTTNVGANPNSQTGSLGPWSDCHTVGVWPYIQPNGTYMAPETYQIISAGADKVFGAGSARNIATQAAPPGSQTITLAAPPAFRMAQAVIVDLENPALTETVLVSAVSASPANFTATFTKSHTNPFSVTGPLWTKATAGDVYLEGVKGGADDIANFHERQLGISLSP